MNTLTKYISISLTALVLNSYGMSHAQTAPATPVDSVQVAATTSQLPGSSLDGVLIPYDVVMDAQILHQGLAVNKAKEIMRSGKKTFVLQLSQDDVVDGQDKIFLTYDSNWKLMTEETREPTPEPPPAPVPEPVVAPTEPVPAEEDIKVEETTIQPAPEPAAPPREESDPEPQAPEPEPTTP